MSRPTETATVAVLALLIAASANGQSIDPKQLKDALTGDAKGPAAANPQCKLFTVAEITALVGAPVGPGENAAGGSGCNWHSKDYAARASVTVVPPNYFPTAICRPRVQASARHREQGLGGAGRRLVRRRRGSGYGRRGRRIRQSGDRSGGAGAAHAGDRTAQEIASREEGGRSSGVVRQELLQFLRKPQRLGVVRRMAGA